MLNVVQCMGYWGLLMAVDFKLIGMQLAIGEQVGVGAITHTFYL